MPKYSESFHREVYDIYDKIRSEYNIKKDLHQKIAEVLQERYNINKDSPRYQGWPSKIKDSTVANSLDTHEEVRFKTKAKTTLAVSQSTIPQDGDTLHNSTQDSSNTTTTKSSSTITPDIVQQAETLIQRQSSSDDGNILGAHFNKKEKDVATVANSMESAAIDSNAENVPTTRTTTATSTPSTHTLQSTASSSTVVNDSAVKKFSNLQVQNYIKENNIQPSHEYNVFARDNNVITYQQTLTYEICIQDAIHTTGAIVEHSDVA